MQAHTCRLSKKSYTYMSRKQSSSSSQQPSLSTGSSDLPLSIGQHRWLRLLGLALLLYLVFLPLWWVALEPLTAIAAGCAHLIYHLFDPSVSIESDVRVARVTLAATDGLAGAPPDSALRMETITYGMPMLASLIVATRPATILGKVEALGTGLALLTALTVLGVMAWARLASLEAYDQMILATTSTKGHTSAFMYYCFHGYAFCQPVLAVIIWMGTSMSGVFERPALPAGKAQTLDPKSPCHCGSGRQYRRCCGKPARLKRA
jgi:hypothetical protein